MFLKAIPFFSIISISFLLTVSFTTKEEVYVTFEANSKDHTIQLFYKDGAGERYGSLGKLQSSLREDSMELVFAMNAGMYMEDRQPLGLYIESGKEIRPLNQRNSSSGNFYLMPNGVFAIDKQGKMSVCQTEDFHLLQDIAFATQSGPMLLINGELHPAFNKGSSNLNIRNGVGILPNGNLLCVMSKQPGNFYDFASLFASKGCQNALYLDGFVSKVYYPEGEWVQKGGNFGAIIAITAK